MGTVHFSKLNEDTKIETLWQICSLKLRVKGWEKGTEDKATFKVEHLDEDKLVLKITAIEENTNLDIKQPFLLNFVHYGIHYFASVKTIKSNEKHSLLLDFNDDLFKCERRNNFRVSVYPDKHYELIIRNTGVPKDARKTLKEHFEYNEMARFRVFDVSANGIALLVSSFWNGRLVANDTFINVEFSLDDEKFTIEEMNVVYLMDCFEGKDEEQGFKKCALKFTKISTKLEKKLIKKLTGELSAPSFDDHFEDFIK